jgi:hypothetical protein
MTSALRELAHFADPDGNAWLLQERGFSERYGDLGHEVSTTARLSRKRRATWWRRRAKA